MDLLKKASFIKKSSLALLIIFACIFAIAIILSIAAGASSVSGSLTISGATGIVAASSALWIVTAVFAVVYYIFCIINAVFIFSTDWKNPKLNDGSCKILWGVFTLILLGTIASLIFGIKAEKELKNKRVVENTSTENK